MFLNYVILLVGSAIFGGATAAGVIALLTTLGFVPRMIAGLHLAKDAIRWESVITLGSIVGCLLSVFTPTKVLFSFWQIWMGSAGAQVMGTVGLLVAGLCSGIYVGCQAMALAEVLNMFPVLLRRIKLQTGLRAAITAIALGKLTGSLWYFVFGYASL